ncbi:sulfatase-like hydrolase/transferase [Hyphomicrobium nitrativorans]|uniref:sulfatase-like hydrolase/transferase n=1 Tax=Hyphomicrobium nitrativorans TaxID=1427356 RepID=UPI000688FC7C|nr:sulfatase-like hydrolase/transferase [Hyphomicrobium nitrativorans]
MTEKGGLTRRNALKLGLAGAMGATGLDSAVAQTVRNAAPVQERARPNILFLLVDEQRYPTVYESSALKDFRATHLPAQSELARRGVSFERHYTASVACVPSRTSLCTGHYPSLHGAANTDGAAKAANDPGMGWLLPGSVPTIGHYLRAGGYRTFWKGKWRVTDADLKVPGTQRSVASYDDTGFADPAKVETYLRANTLDPFGFEGWVGPEPFGADPLKMGSALPEGRQGRDAAISDQVVRLISELDTSEDTNPWFVMASFANPHDISLWGYVSNLAAEEQQRYDFSVPEFVPEEPFDRSLFGRTRTERLDDKPSCQRSFRDAFSQFLPPSMAGRPYTRAYYRFHADVDRRIGEVMAALEGSSFFKNTIVVFTSDHGHLLGAHGGMHQKWYTAYEEALRVPFTIVLPSQWQARSIAMPTSHIDIAPTLLGLVGLDRESLREEIAPAFTDALPLVGRDLSPLLRGEAKIDTFAAPIYFMTDDDPSRGPNEENFIGIAPNSVAQPTHIETVITEIDGEIWKYSRYFDHPRYWSHPGTPGSEGVRDVVLVSKVQEASADGVARRVFDEQVKTTPAVTEYEMYNVSADPMELENLAGRATQKEREAQLRRLLDEQCGQKRLTPQSGPVPGEVGCGKV